MAFNPLSIINSLLAVRLALWLASRFPPERGRRVAYWIADAISRNESWELVQAAYINQWVLSERRLSKEELKEAVTQTFRNTARCIYDLYHNFGNSEASAQIVEYEPKIKTLIQKSNEDQANVMVVSVHLSNFDFIMQTAALLGMRAQAISLANPNAGYRFQNELRQKVGIELTPASRSAFRMAVNRLKQGGVVITGIDRPLPESGYCPRFFGLPARLPVHHIQLALDAGVPIMVVAAIMEPDGIYRVHGSEMIEMKRLPNRRMEILHNAENVLEVAASFIRRAPRQWSMYYPVWPQVSNEIP